MSRILKREPARRDLIELYVWYAESATVDIADRFLRSVESTLNQMSAHPEIGARLQFDDRRLRGLRRWPVDGFRSILLFYLPLPNGVDLVRVIHGKRDIPRALDAAP
jgi:toxin ParE1/3/4